MPGQGRQASTMPRKTNLGVCGVCRRPMKVGDGGEAKSNSASVLRPPSLTTLIILLEIAALTGMGERHTPALYPGREQGNGSVGSRKQRSPQPYDPNEDDPLEHATASSIRSGAHSSNEQLHAVIVAPSIQVRAEFPTLQRTPDPTQPLTCIVLIELPARRQPPPSSSAPDNSFRSPSVMRNGNGNGQQSNAGVADLHAKSRSPRPPSPQESMISVSQTSVFNPTPAPNAAFAAITEDLRNRIIDWKGHPLTGPNGLGPLQLFDILSLRRETQVSWLYPFRTRKG